MNSRHRLRQLFGLVTGVLLVAGCAGIESAPPTATPVPTKASTPTDPPPLPTAVVPTDSMLDYTEANPLDELEEWDLVYISDSTGWGVAEIYAQNIKRDAGKTVRVHNYAFGDLRAIAVLEALQSDPIRFQSLQPDIAEAEVIVFFANPAGDPAEGGVRGGMDNCMGYYTLGNPPEDCTLQLYEPYIENLRAIYEAIFALRDGKTTIIRAVGFYNPLISEHRTRNMEIECTQCWETFNTAVRQAADEFNIPFVSVYDAFNGIDHDEDPREKGYIGSDGVHTSEQGKQVIADILSEAGYEPVEP